MNSLIDWDKVKLFHYVAQAGSFTMAAELLHSSQSALSRSIQALESQMGTQLFQRLPRGLVLTKQGEILLQATQEAVDAFSMAEVLMLEEGDEIEGSLKVATTMALAIGWVIPQISDFMSLHPKLKLTIVGNDDQLDLKTREADVSIRPFVIDSPDLIQEPLVSFHMKLYASQHYLDTYGVPQKPEDLSHHKIIAFGYDAASPYSNVNWILKIGMPKGSMMVPYLCINSGLGMLKAAEAHHGIAPLSAELHKDCKSTLIEILPDLEKPKVPIYYVYPDQLKHSRRVQALGDYLQKRFNS